MIPPPLPAAAPPQEQIDVPPRTRPAVFRLVLGAVALIAGVVLLYFKNPTPGPGETSYFPSCPFHKLTGL